jgi:hypothetical protein
MNLRILCALLMGFGMGYITANNNSTNVLPPPNTPSVALSEKDNTAGSIEISNKPARASKTRVPSGSAADFDPEQLYLQQTAHVIADKIDIDLDSRRVEIDEAADLIFEQHEEISETLEEIARSYPYIREDNPPELLLQETETAIAETKRRYENQHRSGLIKRIVQGENATNRR